MFSNEPIERIIACYSTLKLSSEKSQMLLANDGHHLNLETVASVLFKMTSSLI